MTCLNYTYAQVNNAGIGGVKVDDDAFLASVNAGTSPSQVISFPVHLSQVISFHFTFPISRAK